MNRYIKLTILVSIILSMYGCATRSPSVGGNVAYGDSKQVESLTNEFGLTDLQMMAETMTGSLLTSSLIANSTAKPVITVQEIKNKTSEHINTKQITDKIKVKLGKSNSVTFARDANADAGAMSELQRQNQSGLYARNKTAKVGKAQGAQYLLYGDITSIVKRAGDIKNIDYTLTLQLDDIEQGVTVWSEEKEIRKTSERSTF